MTTYNRRTVLAAGVAVGSGITIASGSEGPIEDKKGGNILGPRNRDRERQNPDVVRPPETDHGTMPNLRFSFSDAHVKIKEGGWSREITQRELPISTAMAGVNMRLNAGGVREMHWHKQAEWAFMLAGRARITAVDGDGRNFIADVSSGDLWYFPAGIPHSIQGLGGDGCEFLLVFPDGEFSEDSTFLLTDMLAHIPRDVLAKNFGVDDSTFANIPKEELFIFSTDVPQLLESDAISGPAGRMQKSLVFRLMEQPALVSPGGNVRIADTNNFPIATDVAAALVEVKPGHLREIHWHPNADEWQYYISGKARMTVFGAETKARTFDYQAGDVGYVPMSMGHYIENIGGETLLFLELFKASRFEDVSLAQWMALSPRELVQAHLSVNRSFLDNLRKEKQPVI